MHGGKPATASEKVRMSRIAELGCVPCWIMLGRCVTATVQHCTDCGVRRGHRFTYGACPWHHFGHLPFGLSREEATEEYGPSLAHGSRPYREFFGADDELIAYEDDLILKAYGEL